MLNFPDFGFWDCNFLQAARQKALAARKRREAEDEEMEKKRKEAAFAKLKELEERMEERLKAEQ